MLQKLLHPEALYRWKLNLNDDNYLIIQIAHEMF